MMNPSALTMIQEHIDNLLPDLAPGLAAAHEPDGNPMPCAVLQHYDGNFTVVAIDPAYMQNIETKENLVVVLRKQIREVRAMEVALMSPVWMVAAVADPLPGEDRRDAAERHRRTLPNNLGDAPDAMEFFYVWHVSQYLRKAWVARITRHADGPPTRGEWEDHLNGAHIEIDRFTDRLQQSIIAVA